MHQAFGKIINKLFHTKNYLKISVLKNGYSYKIYARNAYVGIWDSIEKGFLISRYKTGPLPYLFYEYHWDFDDQFGTVKPLQEIEKCPYFILPPKRDDNLLLKYLSVLEEKNPILPGYNSLKQRKESAIKFERQLSGTLKSKRRPKIHEMIKAGKLPKST